MLHKHLLKLINAMQITNRKLVFSVQLIEKIVEIKRGTGEQVVVN